MQKSRGMIALQISPRHPIIPIAERSEAMIFIFFQKCLQLCSINYKIQSSPNGEVSERLKEHAWKACVLETVPWVRIPPSPIHFFCGEKTKKTNEYAV